MYLNMAIRAHSEIDTPRSAAAWRMAASSSSDMAMEMVFLRRCSGFILGRPGGFTLSRVSLGVGFSLNRLGQASEVV